MGLIFKQKLLRWVVLSIILAFISSSNPIIVAKSHNTRPDQYTEALHKALLFFDAQKSGRLPKSNGVPWRGNSGLQDGLTLSDVKSGLVGGYYDAGDNTKYHFPMAYSMTLLSWSVVEYGHKYKDIGEYDHIRDIIKWGTDYLLLTFNSSAATVNYMYSQVGGSVSNSTTPDDHYCWERPEDMDYARPVQKTRSAPDLGAEVAAARAAASIVFRDNIAYSTKLLKGATTIFKFARDVRRRTPYSRRNSYIEQFYNSTGYWDEYIWSATWLHYATGSSNYINFVTTPGLPKNAKAFMGIPDLRVFSWDNKLPGAELLLTRHWMFLNPEYPQEATLVKYRTANNINFCSYFKRFNTFFWTEGGLIQMKAGHGRPLQYAVNAAFLASLYADYMTAADVPGMYCGPYFYPADALRNFAASQVGGSRINSTTPDDHYCWERPEDMDYYRPVQKTRSAPDLGAEVAAALAAASIVFRDNKVYSEKLIKGATTMFKFARDTGRRTPYSQGNPYIEPFYNSTGYWDEHIWSATWLYYATGNSSYIRFVTDPRLPKNAKAFLGIPDLRVFSWDNKLPGVELLLTRYRIFLRPGYPEEETLMRYQTANNFNLCFYSKIFSLFFWTKGGLIRLKDSHRRPLQYAVNAAFLASLYADYMTTAKVPSWGCGAYSFRANALRKFAASQLNYILGDNPLNMSYVVGYGQKYPKHVHHRGASIPRYRTKNSCKGGWKWRDTTSPNPNIITGAMVGGPNSYDGFHDVRANYHYTEPTLAGNAGLVAALISFSKTSNKSGVDKNSMFSAVPPLFSKNPHPPPPPLWKP